MTRLVIPFPALFLIAAAAGVVLFFQWVIYSVLSDSMAAAESAVQCETQSLDEDGLHLLCGGEEVVTNRTAFIAAWVNEGTSVQCVKSLDWNSDDVSWGCALESETEQAADED